MFHREYPSPLKKFGFHDVFSISVSSNVRRPGKKKTTIKNASSVPRPSRIPMEEIMGSVDVSHNIKPTLDKIDAETPIENIFSFIVFLIACSLVISLRLFV